jgi:hypothetical protein
MSDLKVFRFRFDHTIDNRTRKMNYYQFAKAKKIQRSVVAFGDLCNNTMTLL